jgi:hypothetical protein
MLIGHSDNLIILSEKLKQYPVRIIQAPLCFWLYDPDVRRSHHIVNERMFSFFRNWIFGPFFCE